MLVEVVIVQSDDRGLEDVRRRYRAPRFSPAAPLGVVVQGCLRLRSRQAELAGVVDMPRGGVPAQYPEPLVHLVVRHPTNPALTREDRVHPFRYHELSRTGAVLAHVPQQG